MCIYMYMKIYIYHSPRAPQAHCCCAPHCSRHTLESGPHIYIHTYIYIHMPLATRATGALLCAITTYIYTHIYIYMYHSPRALLLHNNHIHIHTHMYIHVPLATRAAGALLLRAALFAPPPAASERKRAVSSSSSSPNRPPLLLVGAAAAVGCGRAAAARGTPAENSQKSALQLFSTVHVIAT